MFPSKSTHAPNLSALTGQLLVLGGGEPQKPEDFGGGGDGVPLPNMGGKLIGGKATGGFLRYGGKVTGGILNGGNFTGGLVMIGGSVTGMPGVVGGEGDFGEGDLGDGGELLEQ